MPAFVPPIRDMRFVLEEVLRVGDLARLPGFADLTPDTIGAVLDGAGRFAADVLRPLNAAGDREGCRREPDGTVRAPAGFRDAYRRMSEAGWMALSADPAYGGQGLPRVLALAVSELMSSANMAFAMYPGLTHGAYSAILMAGSEEQKQLYLPNLASGRWSGTMNLTEPQCGTDLGLIRTRATPQPDGSYLLTGQKIWISGGEQDLAENIVHLVLARIDGAPDGVKGISLFIVPKFLPGPDGSPGVRNALGCGALEEKMGIHGNATCVMNYDAATGFLLGEANKGMRSMFVMMNEARIGVGVQGLAQAQAAYQAAAAFSRERIQGRSITGPKAPDRPADPIIVHPDVRRMLMDARAFIEGARAFAYWLGLQGDIAHGSDDPRERERAEDRLAVMTPVVKAFLTDRGFRAASDCLQVFGGAGYTREMGVEQFVRDARIALIYEGTNGVQSLDLVGRKLAANGGRAVFGLFSEIEEFCARNEAEAGLAPYLPQLLAVSGQLREATLWLMQNGMADFDNAGAASHDYLQLFGLTVFALVWARMADVALRGAAAGDPFYADKLATARYFYARVLPDAASHLAKVKSGAGVVMALRADAF